MFSGTAAQVLKILEAHDLHTTGTGKYRCNSPLRKGSNSQAFTLIIQSDEHGAYFDHVTGDKGSLYHLAQQLGLEVSPQVPIANTKRVYSGLEDYAAAHGITSEVLEKSYWHDCIKDGRPALSFNTPSGKRWRFLDGDKPYYKSEPGYKACWYGLTPILAEVLSKDHSLVLCNGEISTLVGRQYGLATACVTGGEKEMREDLVEQLKMFLGEIRRDVPILVAFDCDKTGRHAGKMVAQQLSKAGLKVKAIDLKLDDKADLADFCMLHSAQTSTTLEQLPALPADEPIVPVTKRSWYIIPARELRNLPPIEWIIPGEIPDRGLTILFGASGAGKSFLALDYALRISQFAPVMYMAGEGEYGYRQRVAAWCKHHQKEEGQLFMCIGAVQLLEDGDLQAFLDSNRFIHPRIVIVDTMARSMVGSDENSTRDMGLFIKACEDIKHTLDCATLILHHTNKGGVYERGNSALRGASDAMIKVSAEDDLICVESAKTKDAQPFPTRYMKLLPIDLDINEETVQSATIIDADKITQSPEDRLTLQQQKVLNIMNEEIFREGAEYNEIIGSTGLPCGSLTRVLSRLMELDFIHQEGKRSPYVITPEGHKALDRCKAQPPEEQLSL